MFKQSYARGVVNALVQGGRVAFPDENTAAKVADYLCEKVAFEPTNGAVSRDATIKIAKLAIEASEYLKAQPGYKAASFLKVASIDDLSKLAHAHAIDLMQKAAEGSTIEGGDKGNTEPATGEGKMDLAARPAGYAANSLGKTDVDVRPGQVGKEEEQPNKPSRTDSGSNSVTEQSRTASLASLIAKVAEGSTIQGGDKGNTEPTTAEGKMDLAQRPMGYAVLPSQGALGELMNQVKGPAVVGRETTQPNAPARTDSGSNSVQEHSAKAAAEDPFLAVFKKTAAEIAPYLPTTFSDDVKVAHVRACMGMTTEEKAHYLTGLQKEAADKTAAANLPPGSRANYEQHTPDATHSRPGAYDGRSANQGTKQAEMPDFIREKMEKKDSDKDEKKDGDKDDGFGGKKAPPFGAKKDGDEEKKDEKEASLADHFRRISATVQPRS